MMSLIKSFFQNEDGPTTVEYAIMLALIVLVALTAIVTLGDKVSGVFTTAETDLPSG